MTRDTALQAWHLTQASIGENLFFIPEHLRTLRLANERPQYLIHARQRLRERTKSYLEQLRRDHDLRTILRQQGITFADEQT